MAHLKQGIKLKYAKNKKSVKYTLKTIKYSYKKTTPTKTTKYTYKKKVIIAKKKKYSYKKA